MVMHQVIFGAIRQGGSRHLSRWHTGDYPSNARMPCRFRLSLPVATPKRSNGYTWSFYAENEADRS
jgi:hypothetical protein